MDVIAFKKVKGPFGWMSNMSPHAIKHGEETWRTAEALFQAMRFEDKAIKLEIHGQKSPMAAKMVAKRNSDKMVIEQRGSVDMANMRMILGLKLEQYPALLEELLGTGDAAIVEDCTSRHQGSGLFWGAALVDGEWHGTNSLGKMWMEIRKEKRHVPKQRGVINATLVYKGRRKPFPADDPFADRCCDNEDRTMDGGCRNCGDPCL
jgi:ribA/ribD-fused uncharacterized protein